MDAATFSPDELVEIKRTKLLSSHPFFGILVSYLRPEGHPAAWFAQRGLCPTMATDGVRLLYCHEFVRQLQQDSSRDLIAGVLAHEVLHAALGHVWRRQQRELLLWNVAVDMVTNHLLAGNHIALPDDCITMPGGWEALSEEEIYERLLQQAGQALAQAAQRSSLGASDVLPSPAAGSSAGNDARPDGVPGAADNTAADRLAEIWKDRLIRAAKSQGRCPAGIQEMVDNLLSPQQDWRTLLALYAQPHAHDYDWLRPDRRLLATYDIYLPTLASEKLEDLAVAIDTSGSISHDELRTFLSELRGILQAYPWVHVHLVICDAQVWDWQELTSQDPVPTEITGRGGTDFRPVFDEIERRGIAPSALIVFTDGMGSYPEAAPTYPVLWVLTPHHEKPPFGTITVLENVETST